MNCRRSEVYNACPEFQPSCPKGSYELWSSDNHNAVPEMEDLEDENKGVTSI